MPRFGKEERVGSCWGECQVAFPKVLPSARAWVSRVMGRRSWGRRTFQARRELGTQFHGFRWDAVKGMVDLGTLHQGGTTYCLGISADGNTIIGYERSPKGADFLESPSGSSGVVFWRGVERLLHAFGRAGE